MSSTKTRIVEVTVPHLAESLVAATVGKWLKQPGDRIEQYDVICELITEKVTVEMPSPHEGILVKIVVGEGETADVGAPICLLEQEAEEASGVHVSSDSQAYTTAVMATAEVEAEQPMRQRYSPAVQSLANEHQVDLSRVQGSGLGGRITRKDVLQYVQSGGHKAAVPEVKAASASAASMASAGGAQSGVKQPDAYSDFPVNAPKVPVRSTGLHLSENPRLPSIEVEGERIGQRGEYLIDVTPIRSAIARNMRQSVSEIPHAWTMIEVDVTNLVTLRNKLKDEFMRNEGINLTYLAFLLKAVVNAIKDYPIMNSVWAVDKIIVKRDINLSLAVGTEDSVLTPVIQRADQKNIAGLARDIHELGQRARQGKLKLDDMTGGTFTVNNTGSFGSVLSYPIINYPQAAILTFESIVKKPVVIQDMIAVRSMVNLCLSLDHRILDGVICGRFLQRVKENLESYNMDTKLY
jgi:2-oxoisovalerate dehydrogenase E2 component (dihydrolipoyl transacylase)